jgi:serine/threonine-protein kinase
VTVLQSPSELRNPIGPSRAERPEPAAAEATPPLLAGRYRLGKLLGRGSGGVVYAATDIHFSRPVTVKLFDPQVAADPSLRARFKQQAAKAGRLSHPHIAALLDAGFVEAPDGVEQPFVVTEPAGSLSLRDILNRRGRLDPERAVQIARQVASALSYAHRQGLVHADVKPENVLLDERAGRAKLVDFSLSFVSAQTGVVTRATIARRAAYLAPEQVRGETVGPRADVYGLGVMLYEMVVGRPPFVGASPQLIAERRVQEHARPAGLFEPAISPALDAVLSRALERAPDRRWPSVDEFEAALGQLIPSQLEPRQAGWPTQTGLAGRWSSPLPLPRAWSPLGMALPLAAVAVAIALALAFLVPLLRGVPVPGRAAPKEAVPELLGMPIGDARSLALARGYDLTVIGSKVTDRYAKDIVIQQAPVAGAQPDSNQPIRATLSAGVSVPDVRGKSLDNARVALAELGWKVARVEQGSFPGNPAGTVAVQWPAPGETADTPGELLLAVAR